MNPPLSYDRQPECPNLGNPRTGGGSFPASLAFLRAAAILLLVLSAGTAGALESLYLIRHAEKQTPWPNDLTDFQPLSDRGQQRAQAWPSHLAELNIGAIYSSPLSRTVQTAVAVAETLGVPLNTDAATIEAGQIDDFVQRLQAEHGDLEAVLIVGHSNTIPYFLRHFGAEAACDGALTLHRSGNYELIEGYAGLFRIDLGQQGCQALSRSEVPLDATAGAADAIEPKTITLDPAQLTTTPRRYRIAYGKESMGLAVTQLLLEDDTLEVQQTTDLGRAGIRQTATVQLSADGRQHHGLTVTGPMGPSAADIQVQFTDGRAVGHSVFPRSRNKPQGKLTIDRPIPAGTYERNALLALLPAMAIDRITAFSLYAYDGRDDLLKDIQVRVTQPPATERFGGVQAYRAEIQGIDPGYVLWIHPETPRHVLSIEWIDQPWVYDLVPDTE